MNNKKILSRIIFTIIIILYLGKYNSAFALKKAIFPDNKSLQPIPQNSFPKISGNTNSTTPTSIITSTEYREQIETEGEGITTEDTSLPTEKESITSLPIIWVGILIILIVLFFIYKKYHDNKNTI